MECPCASNDRHAREIHGVLDRRNKQIAYYDLRDLRRSGGAASEKLLKQGDKDVPKWRGNECAVDGHLGDTGGQVGAIFAAVASDHGGEDFLEGRKSTGCEHLGPPVRLLSVFHSCLYILSPPGKRV